VGGSLVLSGTGEAAIAGGLTIGEAKVLAGTAAGILAMAGGPVGGKTLAELEEEAEQLAEKMAKVQEDIDAIIEESIKQKGGIGPYRTTGSENYLKELAEQLRRVVQQIKDLKGATPPKAMP
jgi:hypothetical protein